MIDYYLLGAAYFTAYILGVFHAKGHTQWKHVFVACVAGLLWPVSGFYGWAENTRNAERSRKNIF